MKSLESRKSLIIACIGFPTALSLWIGNVILSSLFEIENISIFRWFSSVFIPLLFIYWGLKKNSLSTSGCIAGYFVGFIITLSNFIFLSCLATFFVASSKMTKFRSHMKKKLEENFIEGGKRNWMQVLSNGIVASIIAFIYILDCGTREQTLDNETPLPPNSVLLWEGSRPVRLYFVQQEGCVVSPDKDLKFTAYKLPPGNARNASVLVKAENTWRLGLSKERSHIVRGLQGEFAFYDDSTSPARCVVIVFQNQLKKEEKQRLDVLLTGCSLSSNEPSNAVDRFESGFGSTYDTFTDSFENMLKKQTPSIHKNTNWLRKNTGQAVRFGGSLVSKGIHLVSDSHIDKSKPKEATPRHYEVFTALRFYRYAIEKKRVSRVPSYS